MILLKLSIISKVLVSNAQFYSSKSVIRIAYNFPAEEKKNNRNIHINSNGYTTNTIANH